MKRYPWILLFSLCLVPQAMAAGPDSTVAEKSTRKSNLSSDLDSFVRGAINEGLLTPADDKHAEPVGPPEPEHQVTMPKAGPVAAHGPAADERYSACDGPYALDFTNVQRIGRYQEIYPVRETVGATIDEKVLPAALGEMAKAYIALGLYSEAVMSLKRTPGPEFAPYRNLATLMQNRNKPNVRFFQEMASCQEDSQLWLALAQLVAGQANGVQTLQNSLSGFRKLPLQLRIDYAALSIPELERIGEQALAKKLIADFDEEQVANSSELRFVSALVNLDGGDSAAERTVVEFLDHPQFQEPALAAMLRRKRPMDPAYEEILLGDLMQKFGQDKNSDKHLAASLQFALQELSARSRYQPIMKLAEMPALQNPEAQAEVRRQLVSSLDRDLGGDNPLRNLAAISALAGESGLLDNEPGRDRIFKTATERAIHFGFGAMASNLSAKTATDGAVNLQIATLAFRRHDYREVYALADGHPRDSSINVLAAKSAIKEQNRELLNKLESRLSLQPDTILALIEQDAVSGYWIVSDRIYDAADQLTGVEHEQRVARVASLKRAAQGDSMPARPMSIARVTDLLKSTPLASAPSSRGSN
tara:strand:+ start:1155 stop:2924 length:1770 start_codon:yes stop_codon:yes gene_type:complete